MEFQVVDLRDYSLPFYDEPMAALVAGGERSGAALGEEDRLADGFIFVTAEYNHSIPGVLRRG